jgi:hypothetical protein
MLELSGKIDNDRNMDDIMNNDAPLMNEPSN